MNMLRNRYCAAFTGSKLLASGDLEDVAVATKEALDAQPSMTVLIFDDNSELVEIDFRGSSDALRKRIREAQAADTQSSSSGSSHDSSDSKTGPGRPKLGVVSREVTLMPRHWEWLNSQPGGASVTLRKLVEAARKQEDSNPRKQRDITYKFMSAIAGNETGFEEASRALFAADMQKFEQQIAGWPADIRNHIKRLAHL